MALGRLRELLVGKDQNALFDLQQIEEQYFTQNESIRMIRTMTTTGLDSQPESLESEAKSIMEQILYEFRRQSVSMKTSTLMALCKFYEENSMNRGFETRSGDGLRAHVGLEVLYLHAKLSADELYERSYGIQIERNNKDQKMRRDQMLEDRVVKVLVQLEYRPFSIKLEEDSEFVQKIRGWLSSNAATMVISAVINSIVEPSELFQMTPAAVKSIIETMRIYTCHEWGFLKGCTLRDGIMICTDRLVRRLGGDRFWADTFTLALHEASHFAVRINHDAFEYSSPSSFLPPQGSTRRDPSVADKNLELGRAAEICLFGGLRDGMQVDWSVSTELAAQDFVTRVQNRNDYPWYESKAVCVNLGMVERTNISLSFAGELVHPNQVAEEI